MSLVFLKNDDQSRDTSTAAQDQHLLPYRWSNYFTNPIKIKKNSQVAYIKSSFNVIDNGSRRISIKTESCICNFFCFTL